MVLEAGTVALPQDRSRHPSKCKNKMWKPFAFGADNSPSHDETRPAAFARAREDTYGSSSQEDSVSTRSPSRISFHSSADDSSDFQMVPPRGNGTVSAVPTIFWKGQNQTQTTVEANFDKREVYNVFGTDLPDPQFVNHNAGLKNGQLQFVQHPNGDISAHQWSQERCFWENIGQYSNIRKRVEGQLAGERLRGETGSQVSLTCLRTLGKHMNLADIVRVQNSVRERLLMLSLSQTLHRNTLAYFRIIAQQREAVVMGLPFGVKEIEAALPNQCPSAQSATVAISSRAIDLLMPGQTPDLRNAALQQLHSSLSQQYSKFGLTSTSSLTRNAMENPFSGQKTHVRPRPEAPVFEPGKAISAKFTAHGGERVPMINLQSGNEFSTQLDWLQNQSGAMAAHQQARDLSNNSYYERQRAYGITERYQGYVPHHQMTHHSKAEALGTAPFSRSQMRYDIMKLGESAKERTAGQPNFRTVLYDPFRDPSLLAPELEQKHQLKQQGTLTRIDSAIRGCPSFQPPLSSGLQEVIRGSEPDILTLAEQNTPSLTGTNGMSRTRPAQTDGIAARSYDEELDHWFKGGNTFQRQEDFFESIKSAANKGPVDMSPMPNRHEGGVRLGAKFGIIGTPPKSLPAEVRGDDGDIGIAAAEPCTQKPDFNEGTTRVMIAVLENLASYVQGPPEKRRDYWSRWTQPPNWCIDNSSTGNDSFYDENWGTPPARLGRDLRYQPPVGRYLFANDA